MSSTRPVCLDKSALGHREGMGNTVEVMAANQCLVVKLYHMEHLPYAEIAETLGISINSVGPALPRAEPQLVQILRDLFADE